MWCGGTSGWEGGRRRGKKGERKGWEGGKGRGSEEGMGDGGWVGILKWEGRGEKGKWLSLPDSTACMWWGGTGGWEGGREGGKEGERDGGRERE